MEHETNNFKQHPKREGLSADCKLMPMLVAAILLDGKEHPCDRCNYERKKCRGYEKLD